MTSFGSSVSTPPESAAPANMRWIPAGSFRMGSQDFYPEEGPVQTVDVGGFWIDERLVTAAEFRQFAR